MSDGETETIHASVQETAEHGPRLEAGAVAVRRGWRLVEGPADSMLDDLYAEYSHRWFGGLLPPVMILMAWPEREDHRRASIREQRWDEAGTCISCGEVREGGLLCCARCIEAVVFLRLLRHEQQGAAGAP